MGNAIIKRRISTLPTLNAPTNLTVDGTVISFVPQGAVTTYEVFADGELIGTKDNDILNYEITSINLATLSGWDALASGTHVITVVAKACGRYYSAESEAVSVTKAGAAGWVVSAIDAGYWGDYAIGTLSIKISYDDGSSWSEIGNAWDTPYSFTPSGAFKLGVSFNYINAAGYTLYGTEYTGTVSGGNTFFETQILNGQTGTVEIWIDTCD